MTYLGIDIAKRKFDVALLINGKFRTHHDPPLEVPHSSGRGTGISSAGR